MTTDRAIEHEMGGPSQEDVCSLAPTRSQFSGEESGWTLRKCKVSVVIPVRNEERNIPHVLDGLPDWVYEVILVDGGSIDQTTEVARLHWPAIRIVHQNGNGKGDALREGFRHCTGDVIVALDADCSMDPSEMGRFVAPLQDGFQYAKGSRAILGGGSADLTVFRVFGNYMFRTLTNILHGTRYTDLCYGYFAFSRGTVDALDLKSDGFEIETEISIKAHKAHLRTIEVPSHEWARLSGASSLRAFQDGWRMLCTIIKERFVIGTTSGYSVVSGRPAQDPRRPHLDKIPSRYPGGAAERQERPPWRRAGSADK